ncbi:MAG: hypothetical protein K0V04_45920 [Deltaproteobacteria bacterium]|nr:hypothetical protein [Deltaproteobacteria bacterium]
MYARIAPWLLMTALFVPACAQEDDDTDNSPNRPNSPNDPNPPPPSSWRVGEDGEMVRLTSNEDVSTYQLRLRTDFNAIECKGAATAWVWVMRARCSSATTRGSSGASWRWA